MRAARAGDDRAYRGLLAEIAQTLRQHVYYRLLRYGLDPFETEDIVQEVLIGLHLKRDAWDASLPFTPWLNGVTRHKLLDASKRLRTASWRHADIPLDDWANVFVAEPEDLDRKTLDLDRVLKQLSPVQQNVVQALAVENITVAEVATRYGMSDGSVRMVFHRALDRLFNLSGVQAGERSKRRM